MVSPPARELLLLLVLLVVVLEPVNVNSVTSPIWLKNGTTVRRTNRRSFEITAWTVRNVPSLSTTITGCWRDGEVAHDRNHADHERPLSRVGHGGRLAVEQRDLGRLQHVACGDPPARLDQEVGLDVAENGEAEVGHVPAGVPNCGVASVIARLRERNRQVAGEVRKSAQPAAGGFKPTVSDVLGAADRRRRFAWSCVIWSLEVDADLLEEVVAERDVADFDRDLQVLQAAQLIQQVDDLLVDFLRLADDQAQVGRRIRRSSPARPLRPRWWAAIVEVIRSVSESKSGCCAAAQAARADRIVLRLPSSPLSAAHLAAHLRRMAGLIMPLAALPSWLANTACGAAELKPFIPILPPTPSWHAHRPGHRPGPCGCWERKLGIGITRSATL